MSETPKQLYDGSSDADNFNTSDLEDNTNSSNLNEIQIRRSRSRSIASNPSRYPTTFNLDRQSKWEQFKLKHIKPNVGLIMLIAAQFFNTLMIVSTKLLETNPNTETRIKPLQILVVRMAITYLGTRIYMYIYRDVIPYVPFGDPKIRKWLILRGCTGFFGVFGSYFSLMYLSISDSVLISFLSPSLTIILAWIVLRERVHRYEVFGCIFSLLGVVLIVRPPFLFGNSMINNNNSNNNTNNINLSHSGDGSMDTASYNPVESSNPKERLIATLVALWGSFGMASVYIIIRYIGKRAHAILSVSYFSLITFIISTIGIFTIPSMKFQMPNSLKEWGLFLNLGISGFCFQLLLTFGIQRERAGRGSLIAYTQLIYALLWDIFLYHHIPSFWSFLGMFIIISSTLYVLRLRDDKQNNNNNHSVEYNRNYSDHGLGEEDTELDFDLDLEENNQIHGDSRDIGIPLHEITSGSSRRSEAVEEFPTTRRNSAV